MGLEFETRGPDFQVGSIGHSALTRYSLGTEALEVCTHVDYSRL